MKVAMLSTIDNPFSPFDDYVAWHNWDTQAGYYSAELVGRLANLSHELSEEDYNVAMTNVVDEIVRENVSGMFIKVEKEIVD